MMVKQGITTLFLFASLMSQTIVYVPGSHNDWDLDADNQAYEKTGLGGTTTHYGKTIQASVDGEFKIVLNDWNTTWGAGYWITDYDQRWIIEPGGDNALWKGSPNTTIHVTIPDPNNYSSTDLPLGIMTLSDTPTQISATSQAPLAGSVIDTNDVVVSITLNQSLVTEEKIYLLYTADAWSTDNFILATGSGTSYQATIPAQPGDIIYYILTTTLTYGSGNDLDNYTDLMTLYYDTNNGDNYTYTSQSTANVAPVITSTIDDQTIAEGNQMSFTLTATDANNDSLIWSAQNLPTGAQFTDNTDGSAVFNWTPTYTQSGTYSDIVFIVDDGQGGRASLRLIK